MRHKKNIQSQLSLFETVSIAYILLIFNAQCNSEISVLIMSIYRTLHIQKYWFCSLQYEQLRSCKGTFNFSAFAAQML